MVFIKNKEVQDMIVSWIILTVAFIIVLFGYKGLINYFYFSEMLIIVGLSFILHELAHKFTAQYYGCHAVFKSDNRMLFFTLVASFIGFLFAAPGAVHITGNLNRKMSGKIALAGPLINLIMSFTALVAMLFYNNQFLFFMSYINGILAVFNLLPIRSFDGEKVLAWSKKYWLLFIILSGFNFMLLFL